MEKLKIAFLLITIILATSPVYSQTTNEQFSYNFRLTEYGFVGGYGFAELPDQSYRPTFFIGHLAANITRKLSEKKGHFAIYAEPQWVIETSNNWSDFEYGINFGAKYTLNVGDQLSLFALIGEGPHKITVETIKQKNGFVFNGNIGAGAYLKFSNGIAIWPQYRWNHMSNANFWRPNGGINTNMFLLGISKFR